MIKAVFGVIVICVLISCRVGAAMESDLELNDAIKALYQGNIKEIAATVLERALDDRKSEHGTSFPPNIRWFDILNAIRENDRVVNLGSGTPELSVLCALRGAQVDMVDNRTDVDEAWDGRLDSIKNSVSPENQSILETAFGKITKNNEDCITFMERTGDEVYNLVICENLLHFLSDESQNALMHHVNRTLVSGGGVFTIVDGIPEGVEHADRTIFWVGRAVYNRENPTFTSAIIYDPADEFRSELVKEFQIKRGERNHQFTKEKEQEYLSAAERFYESMNGDAGDVLGVSVELRRLYTTDSFLQMFFTLFSTPQFSYSSSYLKGYVKNRKLIGYSDNPANFPSDEAPEGFPQKVSVVFRKTETSTA